MGDGGIILGFSKRGEIKLVVLGEDMPIGILANFSKEFSVIAIKLASIRPNFSLSFMVPRPGFGPGKAFAATSTESCIWPLYHLG